MSTTDFDIHSDMRAMIAELTQWPPNLTPQQERELWIDFCRQVARPRPAVIEATDFTVPSAAGGVPVRLYKPGKAPAYPCVLYMHGGGWILGNLDTNDSVGWGLAEGTGAAVVSVDYRLAPENPYPAAFDDSRDVLEYIAAHGAKHGIDGGRIAVCGDSAGGNLSAALSLWSRDHNGPRIAAQALIYPVTDIDTDNDSYRRNALAPMLTSAEMHHYLDAYLGSQRQNPEPYAMPGRAKDLSNLPPALVHTAEYDPLCDEGRIYADRLAAAGNSVIYRCARRMVHSFIRARFYGPGAKAEFDFLCGFLRQHLAS
jgi:acetyl esterase/lipase